MPDILLALSRDLVTLSACTIVLILYGRMSALHPAPTYIFYHVWSVTLRLTAIVSGTHAGLERVFRNDPPRMEEIVRAAGAYDLALLAVTLIWLYLAHLKCGELRKGFEADRPRRTIRLSLSRVRGVAVLSIVVGLVSLWYLRFAGADLVAEHMADLGDWSSSAWVIMTATWALQGFAMFHYVRGFPPGLTALTAVVFLLTVLANSARYVLVVWFLFFCFNYLSRTGRKWPTLRITALAALVAIAWFPLKIAVSSYWEGADFKTILNESKTYIELALGPSGNGGDTTFLDQSAVYMTLVDQHGSYFYGTTLLPLLTLPIPRPLWPTKPPVNEFSHAISTPERPVGEAGMVPGIVGEGYANFGYFGVVLFPMLAAYLYGAGYFRAMRHPHQSVQRFVYLVWACMLIQVFRDGLVSVVVFTLVNAMPMTFVLYLHLPSRDRWNERRLRIVRENARFPKRGTESPETVSLRRRY